MRREELDIPVRVETVGPRARRLEMVVGAAERRGQVPVRMAAEKIRAVFLEHAPDGPRAVQPLRHVVRFVVVGCPDRPLGARGEEVGLVAVLPPVQLVPAEGLAG